ncbi:amidohydrolase [Mesonia sp. MT50]|uniref:Amidohydrolase n=1 Tax=Mesonia profundi TaxID=3070998 RepID=A0ABU0ZXA9_9FLAO|nr:amidohydrolase [Mesonia profundi]MDQ7916102.1 amidohydrolase [Mesonia profundi]
MKKLLVLILVFALQSCDKKQQADLIVMNAKVYTVNENFAVAKGFAVRDGKILEVADAEALQLKYKADEVYDAKGRTVYPGFIDAHAHFYGLGLQLQKVDLTGTQSFDEVIERIVKFQEKNKVDFITGRGWDQNDWEDQNFPNKKRLDELFPNTPVAVTRIDGHALLANQKALDLAGITPETKVEGGEIELKNGKLTGILIDNPMSLVRNVIPESTKEEAINGLLEAQKIAISLGLTTIDDAGLRKDAIMLIDSLQKTGDLKMRMYAMVENHPEDVDYFLNEGIIKTERLNVRSVKVYADGALGSRGAALKKPYSDKKNHFGAMLIGLDEFKALAGKLSKTNFQMNTHAIGDSANVVVLKTYDSVLKNEKDRRWRVEHAQIVGEKDFKYFGGNIIPSVQPTHATSDMYWAKDRLGKKRLKNAYAYKKLLKQTRKIALGTDFPIEKVSPFLTFYAAVARQDVHQFPKGGFQKENALSREETLRGMTIWAAYSNFEENEKGSIEKGKLADFIVLDQDLMNVEEKLIPKTKVIATFVGGEKVN